MSRENLLNYCKKWFIENNIQCPKTAREWRGTGKTIPPNTSLTVLRDLGLKPADIINYIHGDGTAKTNRTHNLADLLSKINLKEISKSYDNSGKYTLRYKCLVCGTLDTTDQTTIVRWFDRGTTGCPTCNKSSGKQKPLEYYEKLVPGFSVLARVSSTKFELECNNCNFKFSRSRAQITGKDTETVCCPNCDDNTAYIKGSVVGFDSKIEKELVEFFTTTFPDVATMLQAPYSSFLQTNRKFTADIFLPKYSCVIEISTKSNKLPNYSSRINEKRALCESSNIKFYLCTNKTQLNDIVQSLLKDKE